MYVVEYEGVWVATTHWPDQYLINVKAEFKRRNPHLNSMYVNSIFEKFTITMDTFGVHLGDDEFEDITVVCEALLE